MSEFLGLILSFPTVIWTGLLGLFLLYWLMAIAGVVDLDIFDIDVDMDADAGSVGGVAGLLSTLGLTGVPIMISLSILVLLAWILSFLGQYLLFPLAGTMFGGLSIVLLTLMSVVLFIGVLVLSVPITAAIVKPMAPMFVSHGAVTNKDFLGYTCEITTGSVTEKFGQASIDDHGAGLLVSVRASEPNSFKKGDRAVIISYDATGGVYQIVSESEFRDVG